MRDLFLLHLKVYQSLNSVNVPSEDLFDRIFIPSSDLRFDSLDFLYRMSWMDDLPSSFECNLNLLFYYTFYEYYYYFNSDPNKSFTPIHFSVILVHVVAFLYHYLETGYANFKIFEKEANLILKSDGSNTEKVVKTYLEEVNLPVELMNYRDVIQKYPLYYNLFYFSYQNPLEDSFCIDDDILENDESNLLNFWFDDYTNEIMPYVVELDVTKYDRWKFQLLMEQDLDMFYRKYSLKYFSKGDDYYFFEQLQHSYQRLERIIRRNWPIYFTWNEFDDTKFYALKQKDPLFSSLVNKFIETQNELKQICQKFDRITLAYHKIYNANLEILFLLEDQHDFCPDRNLQNVFTELILRFETNFEILEFWDPVCLEIKNKNKNFDVDDHVQILDFIRLDLKRSYFQDHVGWYEHESIFFKEDPFQYTPLDLYRHPLDLLTFDSLNSFLERKYFMQDNLDFEYNWYTYINYEDEDDSDVDVYSQDEYIVDRFFDDYTKIQIQRLTKFYTREQIKKTQTLKDPLFSDPLQKYLLTENYMYGIQPYLTDIMVNFEKNYLMEMSLVDDIPYFNQHKDQIIDEKLQKTTAFSFLKTSDFNDFYYNKILKDSSFDFYRKYKTKEEAIAKINDILLKHFDGYSKIIHSEKILLAEYLQTDRKVPLNILSILFDEDYLTLYKSKSIIEQQFKILNFSLNEIKMIFFVIKQLHQPISFFFFI